MGIFADRSGGGTSGGCITRRLSKKGLISREAGYSFDCKLLRPSPTAWPFIDGRPYIDKPLAEWTAEDLAAFHRLARVPNSQVAKRRMQASMMLQLSAQRYVEWAEDQEVERQRQINEQAELHDYRLNDTLTWEEQVWLRCGKAPPPTVPPPGPGAVGEPADPTLLIRKPDSRV